jgi:predicted metal-binding membrane protein
MRNIFDLTKREQRIVILIVVALVALAFAKHLLENKPQPPPVRSTSAPTPSPTIHADEEQPESDDSR